MKFTPIDITSWPRGQMFYYFSQIAPVGYSLTAELDVTEMLKSAEASRKRFFPAYLWLVTDCLNKQLEFKVAYQDEKLGYYDSLTPLYAQFHDDDKTFSLMWTDFDEDFNVFYDHYCENLKSYGNNHGLLSQPDMLPPPNAYTVSCVPWINFKHFSLHTYDNKPYFFPSVESGKIRENEQGRMIMPLSITCHHATTDGYHVNEFLETLQKKIQDFRF